MRYHYGIGRDESFLFCLDCKKHQEDIEDKLEGYIYHCLDFSESLFLSPFRCKPFNSWLQSATKVTPYLKELKALIHNEHDDRDLAVQIREPNVPCKQNIEEGEVDKVRPDETVDLLAYLLIPVSSMRDVNVNVHLVNLQVFLTTFNSIHYLLLLLIYGFLIVDLLKVLAMKYRPAFRHPKRIESCRANISHVSDFILRTPNLKWIFWQTTKFLSTSSIVLGLVLIWWIWRVVRILRIFRSRRSRSFLFLLWFCKYIC